MSADDNVVLVDDQIADRGRGQIQSQRLPVVAVIERKINRALGAREEQAFAFGIFAHRIDWLVIRNSVYDLLPRFATVVRTINIWVQVVEPEEIGRASCRERV